MSSSDDSSSDNEEEFHRLWAAKGKSQKNDAGNIPPIKQTKKEDCNKQQEKCVKLHKKGNKSQKAGELSSKIRNNSKYPDKTVTGKHQFENRTKLKNKFETEDRRDKGSSDSDDNKDRLTKVIGKKKKKLHGKKHVSHVASVQLGSDSDSDSGNSVDSLEYKAELQKLWAAKGKSKHTEIQAKSDNEGKKRKLEQVSDINSENKLQKKNHKYMQIDGADSEESSESDNNQQNLQDETEEQKDDEEDEYENIKKELSTMSFEEIIALRDRLGTKVYNQVLKRDRQKKNDGKKVFKRENKNRPMEISSKKTVSRFREVVPVKKKLSRDPRFDDLSGEFKEDLFKKAYSFLDDVKEREKEKIQKKMVKEKDPEKQQKLKLLYNRMKQQELSAKQKNKQEEIEKEWKKKEQELVKQGKTPYYLKKADIRKLELAEKFRELKKSGKVDQYLKKKRKKNAQKEKKRLFTKNVDL